ncbi:unnamed protein product, partial [Amoebophrya sp. A25]
AILERQYETFNPDTRWTNKRTLQQEERAVTDESQTLEVDREALGTSESMSSMSDMAPAEFTAVVLSRSQPEPYYVCMDFSDPEFNKLAGGFHKFGYYIGAQHFDG